LTSYRAALRFILAQQRGKVSLSIQCTELSTRVGRKNLRTLVYSPPNSNTNPIVLLHGMSVMGIDDPRQLAAVNALCAAGFRVICPELQEIRDLKIRSESVQTFIDFLQVMRKDRDLAPNGRFALFAPSFSGAIILRAAAHESLRQSISAVCCIGAMSGIRGSMENIFLGQGVDPYARFVVLSNYLPFSAKYKKFARVFKALALDNWHRTENHSEREFARLKTAERRLALKIRDDDSLRAKIIAELMPRMEKELAAYGVLAVASRIISPTFLLHGADDDVIPPAESCELALRLESQMLVVSPFIGHADTKVSVLQIADILKLISGFAYFFRHAVA